MKAQIIRIDTYYDVRCDKCCRARSVDINGGLGLWEADTKIFRKVLAREGWGYKDGMTLYPNCMAGKEHPASIW